MRIRPRRLRRTRALRDLVAETRIPRECLVQPHFVLEEDGTTEPLDAMPGIDRMGVTPLLKRVEADLEVGLRTLLLFGVTDRKDPRGTSGTDLNAPAHRGAKAIKKEFGDEVTVMADVCLCTYTDHGHCGVLQEGQVDNDPSLELLAAQSVALAKSGADVVAPSDMMDGRVRAIRDALDENGFSDRAIMSYAAKYASSFYGPFREAADSAPKDAGPKDRKTYQMDSRNVREALREVKLDAEEGADIVMVKPALAYLDVIAAVREETDLPLAAYLVSGEYAAVKLLVMEGLASEPDLVREHLGAVRRAGADILITYHARRALEEKWL